MFVTFIAAFLLLVTPENALAWGPGFHLQLGTSLLGNLAALPAAAAAIIGAYPNDFLYGCIAADITVGKKYTAYLKHCHRWNVALNLLERAESGSRKACAYGYLSHLAADTVAHSYYVPLGIMRSYQAVVPSHAYWEVRFDSLTPPEIWETGHRVALENFRDNDEMLREEISRTIFSFGTNKKIFNSILIVSKLDKWQQLIGTMHDVSRFPLDEGEISHYAALSGKAVLETVVSPKSSPWLAADPTGEDALKAAEQVRKNLRLLYGSGKISREAAAGELEEMKKRLENAILAPDRISGIIS